MKIRHGFVTNSSSSSFIISTKDEVPSSIEHYFKLLTNENILDFFMEEIYDYNDYQELEKIGCFTTEQINLIKLYTEDKLTDFSTVKQIIESAEDNVYSVSGDRDWFYSNYNLQEFFQRATVTKIIDLSD